MLCWLRDKRENKELSQAQLSSIVGLSRAGYTNIENGNRQPSVPTAKKIAAVLEFEWSMFFN